MTGLLTEIVSNSLALDASQDWDDVYLYTPFLNDQALLYEYAECLAAQAFLRIAQLSYSVRQRPNAEFISPSGKVPLLKVRRTLVPEFSGIVDFVAKKGIKLCAHLSDTQVAEMRAHMSLIDVLLRNVELYITWKHDDTYKQLTRYRYGSVYKWPLNWILPALKRREILTKLQDNGWADKGVDEVLEQYDKALRALSSQLGSKPFLFGNQPTEADALLFGHLFTIITTKLPCMDLKNAILSYANLQEFSTRFETEYFKI
ncbi:hypothetical protein V3C99_002617 [Haemonchus contortus]|uniref:Outer mitochondrial membrane transport complex protein domain containing protein n=1 Tax=Haemonchus contortus TaxID=6289 RepID=U6PV93_HAECO|nr:Outer mitochondrial membrane transport complex protein domain containing protein [Haemonchus contortus]